MSSYFPSVASRTMRRAAWLESSVVCPGLCAFLTCSAKALLMEGSESLGNGILHTEQRLTPKTVIRWAGRCDFAMQLVSHDSPEGC